jgi:DNA-binding transcriptional regulator YiaG
MTSANALRNTKAAPIIVAVPSENVSVPLRMLFVSALVACSSTSTHAASVGSMRMDGGSTGLTVVARQQDINPSLADGLAEIKRRSGLTWSQLATIFEVSRRTVHSWVNGTAVRITHVGRINKLLEQVRELDGRPAFKVRDMLLGPSKSFPNSQLETIGEPPILVSDNSPFVHQLKLRSATTKVKRG